MMIELNMRKDRVHTTADEAASTQPTVEIDKKQLCKKLSLELEQLEKTRKAIVAQLEEANTDYKEVIAVFRELEKILKRDYHNDEDMTPEYFRVKYKQRQDDCLAASYCYNDLRRFIVSDNVVFFPCDA
jgi:hypothetical protein